MAADPQDLRRAQVFGQDAERYDRARPIYPSELIDDLMAGKPRNVLDVGCGTGKAAREFAARGCDVLGVEPDSRMAAVGRSHGISVEVTTFEDWEPHGRMFDLVISGQAWHWIDHQLAPQKAAAIIPSGGRLAIFWNHGEHDAESKALISEAHQRHAPSIGTGYAPMHNLDQTVSNDVAAIIATDRFQKPDIRAYQWQKSYSRDEWLDQLGTHSDHIVLPRDQFNALVGEIGSVIDRLGGSITLHFATLLISARRK